MIEEWMFGAWVLERRGMPLLTRNQEIRETRKEKQAGRAQQPVMNGISYIM